MGYDILRYSPENFYELKRIKVIKNLEIDLVLDVGASEGFYGEELREDGYSGQIISFEPLLESFKMLANRSSKDPLWLAINSAVGDKERNEVMSVSGHITSSSLLEMTEEHIDAMPPSATVNKQEIKVITLNSLSGNLISENSRIYLKVDVQGFEMFVIKGADLILDRVKVIEMELTFKSLYNGGVLFNDMIKHLESLGFFLVSLKHVFSNPHSDQLLQMDGLFKRI